MESGDPDGNGNNDGHQLMVIGMMVALKHYLWWLISLESFLEQRRKSNFGIPGTIHGQ